MRIFDNIDRNDFTLGLNAESSWSFFNRSDAPGARRVRALLEKLLDEYPEPLKSELVARFRSDEFEEAYFELVLHSLLHRHGASVEIHSATASANANRPDFLASFPDGQKVVFEAVIAKDKSARAEASETSWAQLYDQINMLQSDFFIEIELPSLEVLDRPPAPRRVLTFLRRELAKLDARTERERLEADSTRYFQYLPKARFHDKGMAIDFEFIPKSEALRGSTRSIGFYPASSRMGGSAQAIKSAIDSKATKYGEVKLPYVVIVNSLSPWDHGLEDHKEALLGRPVVGSGGAFVREDGTPQNTRVSAVVIGTVWLHLGRARLTLYENPSAQRPACVFPWRLDRRVLAGSKKGLQIGQSIGELLGLPEDWPGRMLD